MEDIGIYTFLRMSVILSTIATGIAMPDYSGSVIVTSVLEPPFLMRRQQSDDNRSDNIPGDKDNNAQYEGFIVDLINAIGRITQTRFVIREAEDRRHGARDDEGRWSGMIGEVLGDSGVIQEVLRGKADMAAGPLLITKYRKMDVDFSMPFMRFGYSIVFKDSPQFKNIISLEGLLNMTKAGVTDDVNNTIRDIVFNYLHHDTIVGGLMEHMYKNEKQNVLKQLWAYMSREQVLKPSKILVDDINVALKRIRDDGVIMIMETPSAEYITESLPCDLRSIRITDVGTNWTEYAYGFATEPSSPLQMDLNQALSMLEFSGELQLLRERWWQTPCLDITINFAASIENGAIFFNKLILLKTLFICILVTYIT
ncbi:unnamed protein product [Owenia fusiformis]|uniref:Uncharacterized protein n=1 Tax=Owenia fusiformis TaxID=6347 RepID=A0A8J1UUQ2_OWEFU|nr:unnamed protein product [Owenia fusiformis]